MKFQKWDAFYADIPVVTGWEGKVVHPGLTQSDGNGSDEH